MKYIKAADMDGRNQVALQDRCLYNKEKKSKLKYVCAMSGQIKESLRAAEADVNQIKMKMK